MDLLSEVRGNKKPSPVMSIEIVRFYAFAAPASSLAQQKSSISTAESGLRLTLSCRRNNRVDAFLNFSSFFFHQG